MAARLRVALDMRPTLLAGTGIARYATSLALALAAAGDVEVHLLYKQPPSKSHLPASLAGAERQASDGVRLFSLHAPLWLQTVAPAYCAIAGIDVFHGTNYVVPLVRSCAAVATIHDLTLLTHPRLHTVRNRLMTGVQMQAGLRRCDAVLADSQATARHVAARWPWLSARTTVVPLGVAPGFRPTSTAEGAALRQRYHLHRPYLLFIGTKEPRKNLGALLHAFALCRQRGLTDYDLVLAGRDGGELHRLQSQITQLGLGPVVRSIGLVPEADLPTLYSSAALFVFPSLAEGFGLPVLEAMACGTPVVATPDPAVQELAGQAAAYAASSAPQHLAEAIAGTLADPSRQQALVQAGLEQAQTRQWTETARATVEVYRQARHSWPVRRKMRGPP